MRNSRSTCKTKTEQESRFGFAQTSKGVDESIGEAEKTPDILKFLYLGEHTETNDFGRTGKLLLALLSPGSLVLMIRTTSCRSLILSGRQQGRLARCGHGVSLARSTAQVEVPWLLHHFLFRFRFRFGRLLRAPFLAQGCSGCCRLSRFGFGWD